jgi:hypothetical protein
MPAVIAIPIQPPITTRSVGVKIFEPAILALITPVISSPARVNPTMLRATVPVVGAKAPANGIKPPDVKAAADAIAACTGRAYVCGC